MAESFNFQGQGQLYFVPTIAGAAEFVLDRALDLELVRGWQFNTVYNKSYTGTSITFGTNVVRAVPSGPSWNLPIVMRSGVGYDVNADSATFASASSRDAKTPRSRLSGRFSSPHSMQPMSSTTQITSPPTAPHPA